MDKEYVERLKARKAEANTAVEEAQRNRNRLKKELAKAEEAVTNAQLQLDTVNNMLISALEK